MQRSLYYGSQTWSCNVGSIKGREHIWCVDTNTDTIVDPTVSQFHQTLIDDADPTFYKVLDPNTDYVCVGKCCRCRDEIMDLAININKDTDQVCELCRIEEDEET